MEGARFFRALTAFATAGCGIFKGTFLPATGSAGILMAVQKGDERI